MHKAYKNQTRVYLQLNIIKLIKNQLYISYATEPKVWWQ